MSTVGAREGLVCCLVCQSVFLISPLLSAVTSLDIFHECKDVSVSLVFSCFKMKFLHAQQQELDQSLPQRQLEDHRRVCTAVKRVQN